MTYRTHADITESQGLRRRLVACAATEGATQPPASWVAAVVWSLPTSEWVDAWESARAAGAEGDIGDDDLVITDAMILAAVQLAIGAEAAD
jgi:hypothetical protein